MFSICMMKNPHTICKESFDWGENLMGRIREKLLSLKDFSEVVRGEKGEMSSVWIYPFSIRAFASFCVETNEFSFNTASCAVTCLSSRKKWKWLPWWLCLKYKLTVPVAGIYFKGYIKKEGKGEIKWNEGCYVDVVNEALYKKALEAERESEKKETEETEEKLNDVFREAEKEVRDLCSEVLSF
ncbi:MAG: hypothetical protein PHZ25_01810 [Candidatus Pacebacteria bacterium]|nr:hypothetical protein [Candidatus Paceibacterota bacterium]